MREAQDHSMSNNQDHNMSNNEPPSATTTITTAEPSVSSNSVCKPDWTDPVMSALSHRIDGLDIDGQTMPPPSTPASATASTTTAARSFHAATPATLYAGTTAAALLPPAPPPSPPLGARRARVLGLREGEGEEEEDDDDDGAFEQLSPGARRPGPSWEGEVSEEEVRERRRTAREWVGALRESWRGERVAWRPWVRGRVAMGYGGVTRRRGRAAATARGGRGRDVEMAELVIVGEPVRRSGDGEVRREAGLRSWVGREDVAAEMIWETGTGEGRVD